MKTTVMTKKYFQPFTIQGKKRRYKTRSRERPHHDSSESDATVSITHSPIILIQQINDRTPKLMKRRQENLSDFKVLIQHIHKQARKRAKDRVLRMLRFSHYKGFYRKGWTAAGCKIRRLYTPRCLQGGREEEEWDDSMRPYTH